MSDDLEGVYRFTVRMHGRVPGELVYVAPEERDRILPLVQAGYLVPLAPPPPAVRRPTRRTVTAPEPE